MEQICHHLFAIFDPKSFEIFGFRCGAKVSSIHRSIGLCFELVFVFSFRGWGVHPTLASLPLCLVVTSARFLGAHFKQTLFN